MGAAADRVGHYKLEKGPKVAKVEVTLPSGQKKTQGIFNDAIIGFRAYWGQHRQGIVGLFNPHQIH